MCVCVCVCERERGGRRKKQGDKERDALIDGKRWGVKTKDSEIEIERDINR